MWNCVKKIKNTRHKYKEEEGKYVHKAKGPSFQVLLGQMPS